MRFGKTARQGNQPSIFKFTLTTVIFLFGISFIQKSQANELQNLVVFELKHISKNFEIYNIKIFQDGKVYYHENKIINEVSTKAFIKPDSIPIDHYAQLTKAQLDELVVEFLSLPFKELPKYESKFGLGGSAATVTFKLELTDIYIINNIFHNALLTMLKKYISKDLTSWLLNSWLCSPYKQDKDFIQHCEQVFFLPDNFKF